MDICPEDRRGKHHMIALEPFGGAGGNVTSTYCTKCGKNVDYSENTSEESFPDLQVLDEE